MFPFPELPIIFNMREVHMINFNETFFPYFKDFCIEKFGRDMGMQLYEKSELKLNELIVENDDRNDKYIRWHLNKNMLPIISIYLMLKDFDNITENALQYTDEIMQISRLKMKKKNQLLGKLPFAYRLFKIFSRRVVSKQYPDKGWNIQWITIDANEVHFDMKSCIYVEITNKYNCSELCHLFCENDDVTLSGYQPSIVFKREKTIARGQEKCDFHFYNSKFRK
jgi:hypothetical protein